MGQMSNLLSSWSPFGFFLPQLVTMNGNSIMSILVRCPIFNMDGIMQKNGHHLALSESCASFDAEHHHHHCAFLANTGQFVVSKLALDCSWSCSMSTNLCLFPSSAPASLFKQKSCHLCLDWFGLTISKTRQLSECSLTLKPMLLCCWQQSHSGQNSVPSSPKLHPNPCTTWS